VPPFSGTPLTAVSLRLLLTDTYLYNNMVVKVQPTALGSQRKPFALIRLVRSSPTFSQSLTPKSCIYLSLPALELLCARSANPLFFRIGLSLFVALKPVGPAVATLTQSTQG
jgi:hypothetical protein